MMILHVQHEVKLVNKTLYRRWEINHEYVKHVQARTKQALHAQFPRGHKLRDGRRGSSSPGPWWFIVQQLYSGKRPDTGSCANSAKAILDAVVNEEVIPDDKPRFVSGHVYLPPLKVEKGDEGAVIGLAATLESGILAVDGASEPLHEKWMLNKERLQGIIRKP